jgi:uncharacterized membrane protein YfcA
MESLIPYLLTGACIGMLSGLLGIGGGLVIVPVLVFTLSAAGVSGGHVMQVALGTSLATIIFTSISSARAHHRHQAVNWKLVCSIAPGIIAGTLLGSWLGANMQTGVLKFIFTLFAFAVGTELMFNARPKPSRELPGRMAIVLVGAAIGGLSSLVGIGGGSLSVPFMIYCNVPMRQAVGTSSAIGLPIALAGATGYALAGLKVQGLPQFSLGYIYLPALAGIALASVLTAPIGARLAHRLPVPQLKKVFALLLYGLGVKMAWGLM